MSGGELFEIECREGCRCLVVGLDGLEEVLARWCPQFVSVRSVDLSPKELLDRLEEMARGRSKGLLGCGRLRSEASKAESWVE